MSPAFGDRLWAAMRETGPLCVGIDPHPHLLVSWGLHDDVAGLEAFSRTVIEAAAGAAAVIKPQIALFERHGSAGLAVVESLLARAREAGLEVIADAKRGDIGSTMRAYAQAWLGDASPLASDAVTLSPYLGFGSLAPALETAEATGRGTFVLALTSNPEGASVQHRGAPGESVAAGVLRAARERNAAQGYRHAGSCGLVVGATVGPALRDLGLDLAAFNGLLLAPGYGAQGATEEDLARVFAGAEDRLVVSSSRGILAHGPDPAALRTQILEANRRLVRALDAS